MRLLQRIRDETHRFATTRNQKLRTKENTTLIFEELPGIGKQKAVLLLERYGSLEKLSGATATQEGILTLAKDVGLSIAKAQRIAEALPLLLQSREEERTKRKGGGTYRVQDTEIEKLAKLAAEGSGDYSAKA